MYCGVQVLNGSGEPGPALARRARELAVAGERLAAATARAQALVASAHQRYTTIPTHPAVEDPIVE